MDINDIHKWLEQVTAIDGDLEKIPIELKYKKIAYDPLFIKQSLLELVEKGLPSINSSKVNQIENKYIILLNYYTMIGEYGSNIDTGFEYEGDITHFNLLLQSPSPLIKYFTLDAITNLSYLFYDKDITSIPLILNAHVELLKVYKICRLVEHRENFYKTLHMIIEMNRVSSSFEIGDAAATFIKKYSIEEIKKIFLVVFEDDLKRPPVQEIGDIVKFLCYNVFKSLESGSNISLLKDDYLKLIPYVLKYRDIGNNSNKKRRGNDYVDDSSDDRIVPEFYFINQNFDEKEVKKVTWNYFIEWTKNITKSKARILINAIGILYSFGIKSTLVSQNLKFIMEKLDDIFNSFKHEILDKVISKCLFDIIKEYKTRIPIGIISNIATKISSTFHQLSQPNGYKTLIEITKEFKEHDIISKPHLKSLMLYHQAAIDGFKFFNEYILTLDDKFISHENFDIFYKMLLACKIVSKDTIPSLIKFASSNDELISILTDEKCPISSAHELEILTKLQQSQDFDMEPYRDRFKYVKFYGVIEIIEKRKKNELFLENYNFIQEYFKTDDDIKDLFQIVNDNCQLVFTQTNSKFGQLFRIIFDLYPMLTISSLKEYIYLLMENRDIRQVYDAIHQYYRIIDLEDVIQLFYEKALAMLVLSDFKSFSSTHSYLFTKTSHLLTSITDFIEIFSTMYIDPHSDDQVDLTQLFAIITTFYDNIKLLEYPFSTVSDFEMVFLSKSYINCFFKYYSNPETVLIPEFIVPIINAYKFIDENDPIIQEHRKELVDLLKGLEYSNLINVLVEIKSNNIKSLEWLYDDLESSLPDHLKKYGVKSKVLQDINSVLPVTQLIIIQNIIKQYFNDHRVKLWEFINLSQVSKLFLSSCQNLFKLTKYSYKGPPKYNIHKSPIISFYKFNSVQSTKPEYSLFYKGIYHMDYKDFEYLPLSTSKSLLYQLSSLTIKNPCILYEFGKDLDNLTNLTIDLKNYAIIPNLFKRLTSLNKLVLKVYYGFAKPLIDVLESVLLHCMGTLKQLIIKYIIEAKFIIKYDQVGFRSNLQFKVIDNTVSKLYKQFKEYEINSKKGFKFNIHVKSNELDPFYSISIKDFMISIKDYNNKLILSETQQTNLEENNDCVPMLNNIQYLEIYLRDFKSLKRNLTSFPNVIHLTITIYTADSSMCFGDPYLAPILNTTSNNNNLSTIVFNFIKIDVKNQILLDIIKTMNENPICLEFSIQTKETNQENLANILEVLNPVDFHNYTLISPMSATFIKTNNH